MSEYRKEMSKYISDEEIARIETYLTLGRDSLLQGISTYAATPRRASKCCRPHPTPASPSKSNPNRQASRSSFELITIGPASTPGGPADPNTPFGKNAETDQRAARPRADVGRMAFGSRSSGLPSRT